MFCFVQITHMFTLLYYFCCNIVACSLIYSHEILGIWCSIPQIANVKSIVRASGNLSSVPPPPEFLGLTTRWAQVLSHYRHYNTV
jgi:hypothetical protein